MADVQAQFEKFHELIRADYDIDEPLRERRDRILKRLREKLQENERPGFRELLQGSYKMRTGVKPIDDVEFDIDVGLRFDIDPTTVSAESARAWVFEAVDGHTKSVTAMSSCIRVDYADKYHVDLVVYSCRGATGAETFKLASKDNGWRDANPPALEKEITSARKPYEGTEDTRTSTDQFRRIIRYLKRWYDEAIPSESKDKPSGLAYTLLAMSRCAPRKDFGGDPDDLAALRQITTLGSSAGRITVKKPTPEFEDLFAGLSDDAMDNFKTKLKALDDALALAANSSDRHTACKELARHFGRDFPIPDPEDGAKRTKAPAIVPASSSA